MILHDNHLIGIFGPFALFYSHFSLNCCLILCYFSHLFCVSFIFLSCLLLFIFIATIFSPLIVQKFSILLVVTLEITKCILIAFYKLKLIKNFIFFPENLEYINSIDSFPYLHIVVYVNFIMFAF